jgi:hypothetical protein
VSSSIDGWRWAPTIRPPAPPPPDGRPPAPLCAPPPLPFGQVEPNRLRLVFRCANHRLWNCCLFPLRFIAESIYRLGVV